MERHAFGLPYNASDACVGLGKQTINNIIIIYLFDIVQRHNRQSTCENPQQTPRGLAVACQRQPEAVYEAVLFRPHHVRIDATRSGAHGSVEIATTDGIHKSQE